MKNFGFLLMEFKVLIIVNLPLNWDFVFCALGFARNVFGVLNIFTSQNHFCICKGVLLLEKLWASRLAQGLGPCWILFLGSTSCNFSDFWVCSSCSRFE